MMKKALYWIAMVLGALIGIYGLVVLVIECYNLFGGLWNIGDGSAQAFFHFLLRLILALFMEAVCLLSFFNFFKRECRLIPIFLYCFSFTLLIIGLVFSNISINHGQKEFLILMIDLVVPLLHFCSCLLLSYFKRKEALESEKAEKNPGSGLRE